MARGAVELGLTLPNRGVMFGVTTPTELVALAETADASGCFASVWVGDSILSKPRLEALSLISAIAVRTKHVRVGSACLSSFALRHPILLADQWASIDLLAEGRTILCVCKGDLVGGGDLIHEWTAMDVPIKMRYARMEEGIDAVRRLFTEDDVTFEGKYYHFEHVTLAPRPETPPPIWISASPHVEGAGGRTIRNTERRIARYADGWMTSYANPESFQRAWHSLEKTLREYDRDAATFPRYLYYNININEDTQWALEESKEFLEAYYMTTFTEQRLDEMWVAAGPPERCAERLNALLAAGPTGITLRITAWNQEQQLRRLVDEVIPRLHLSQAAPSGVAS